MNFVEGIVRLHSNVFDAVERICHGWLLELTARFIVLAVLYLYYFKSWQTKVGDGLPGLFQVSPGAYFQIVPGAVEAAGGDISQIGPLSQLIVFAGVWAELLLPILIIVGLFTRAAALGMIVFVLVQSYVDIAFHGVGAETIGAWFDRFPDSAIMDQRAFWIFTLLVLVVKGAGTVSLDYLLSRNRDRARMA